MKMAATKTAFQSVDVESLPRTDLARLGEERLIAGQVIRRAAGSSLYRHLWPRWPRRLPAVRDRRDLQRLPFTSRWELRDAQSRWPMERIACAPVYAWASSHSQGETRTWMPFGKKDIELVQGLLDRLARKAQVKRNAVVLAVTPLAPRLTNALPYLWLTADMAETKMKLEFIVTSMYMLGKNNWPEFALRRQPDILLCRPGDALILAEHFPKAAGRPAARPRDVLPNLKTGIFFGEPLAPSRNAIVDAYGLEPYDLYLSAEHPGMNCDCRFHQGIHFWMDTCIPEIIPAAELNREQSEPGYRPRAVFLDCAAPECRGELVVTTFAEAMPLVRYRSGDIVRLIANAPCPCGSTHPRIQVLGRHSQIPASEGSPS
jgi:phenylacetate-CoA ligase